MNARRNTRGGWTGIATQRGGFLANLLRVAVVVSLIAPVPGSLPSALAQTGGSPALEAKLDEPGTLMLRNATLADWAFAIKQEWGINIVSGANLQNETVDAGFEETPLRDILSEILFVRGYAFQPVGNSLRIVKLEDLGVMRPGYENAILPLEVISPDEALKSVNLIKSPDGTVQAVPSSRSLIVIDTPEKIKAIQAHLSALENNARKHAERMGLDAANLSGGPGVDLQAVRQRVEVYPVQFLNAEDIVSSIEAVVPDGRVSALTDENRLIVVGSPAEQKAALELLQRIDVARQQVRITALLYDVDLEVMEQFGFNWSNSAKGRLNASGDPQSLFALSSDNFTASTAAPTDAAATAAGAAATAATTGSLGGLATLSSISRHFDITTVIRTLDTTDGSRLLARPNIIAYDRVQATFQSVSEIPVQELTQTDAGGNIGTTNFREAGITLTVTPSIMQDGSIKMDVTPEFSVLAGFQSGNPVIDRRSATTTVQLMNGQTTVIGGLLRRNELEKQSGLPGLSKLKYFGALFRDHDTTVSESELLVFIQAEIIPLGQPDKPRDEAAKLVAKDLVENVPYASHGPITPYCGDPYCPYHHPRPWGSALPPSACSACQNDKGHGLADHPDYYQQSPPVTQVESEYVPAPAGGTAPSADSPANVTPLPNPISDGAPTPPPVIVDEARRRALANQRSAMRRLPPTTFNQTATTSDRGRPQLPSESAVPFTPPKSRVRTANGQVQPLPATRNQPPASSGQVRQAVSQPWWKKILQ